jgi:hypothetical protein
MLRTIITYGLIGGAIAGGVSFVTFTVLPGHLPTGIGMALGYTTMLVALSTIFLAVKRYRDQTAGGRIGFWPALGIGLGVTLIAAVMYALGWEAALVVNGGPDVFIDGYLAQRRAEVRDPAALADEVRQMEAMRAGYRNPLFRIPMTMTEILPVGALVSLVTAGLLRNPRMFPAR